MDSAENWIMSESKIMRDFWMVLLTALGLAVVAPAVGKEVNLSGAWILDTAKSDLGNRQQHRSRSSSFPSWRSIIPGIEGYPGGGYPSSYPGGSYPSGYPGGSYPNGYPGSGPSVGYPRGRDGGEDGGTRTEMPADSIKNLTLQIVQTKNEVQTTRHFTVNGEEKAIVQKFALDGSQDINPASNGRGEFVSRSTWKKDKLINSGTETISIKDKSYEMSLNEEYSLSKDGKTLTIKTTRISPRGETKIKQVFQKQEFSSAPNSRS
jgi:hypothetical protein